MIKEDKVYIKINNRNSTKYLNLGYNIIPGESLLIDTKDLNKGSLIKITAICDLCNSENHISYSKYLVNVNRNDKGYYSCFSCKDIEKVKTCLIKYGEVSFSKTDEFRISESKRWKGIQKGSKKGRETCLLRYGVRNYFKTDKMREYNRIWMSSPEFKEKSKESLLLKYGHTSFSKTSEFKKIHTLKKDSIISKMISTSKKRYGTNWYNQSIIFKDYIRDRHNSNRENIKEFRNYRNLVNNITRRYKEKLYSDWNGYDYYDKEYIRDYSDLKYTHRLYPTIDHKISVYNGFLSGMSPEIIGNISNLCITKRSLNSSKRIKNSDEFNPPFQIYY